MSIVNCDRRHSCTDAAVVASLIVGIVTALLTFTAVITVAPVFLWVVFGIAVAFLAVILLTAAFGGREVRLCINSVLAALLTGILGSILTSLILLAVGFAATSIVGAIVTGAMLVFFSLIITVAACLARCLVS